MQLSKVQIEAFRREGLLVIPRVFSPPELAVLEAALPQITESAQAKIQTDATTGTVRMSHGAHLYSEAFRRLCLHPRLVQPSRQLVEAEIHLYQSRLEMKAGLGKASARGWPWHQDFSTWNLADGMPEPKAVIVFLFLDDVTVSNGPLLVVPGSHRHGMIGDKAAAVGPDGEYRQLIIAPEDLRDLAGRDGIAALTGSAGTVAFLHCNLVHGSTENISPMRRALFGAVFNAVDNRPTHPRPEYWAASQIVPIRPLADDCLLRFQR